MTVDIDNSHAVGRYIPADGEWPCQFDPKTLPPARVTALLYRLMRDHLPTGVIEQVLIDIRDTNYSAVEYTNLHLRDLAFSHAGYLTEGYVRDRTP